MSVIANMRNLSNMEFYKNAIYIRKEITLWLLRDFGTKKSPKNIKQIIKDITPEEQKTIKEIFEKYDKSLNKEFSFDYPEWFIDAERRIIIEIMWNMVRAIVSGNSIYPTMMCEWELRRTKQDEAICCCHNLFYELDYINRVFPQNLNYFEKLLESIDKEEHLLKGWRQGDNKERKKHEQQLKVE